MCANGFIFVCFWYTRYKRLSKLWAQGRNSSFQVCAAHYWRAALGIRPYRVFWLFSWLTSVPLPILISLTWVCHSTIPNCLIYHLLEIKNEKATYWNSMSSFDLLQSLLYQAHIFRGSVHVCVWLPPFSTFIKDGIYSIFSSFYSFRYVFERRERKACYICCLFKHSWLIFKSRNIYGWIHKINWIQHGKFPT